MWVRLCHKPRGVAARLRLHRVCMKCEVASSLLEFLARNLAALAVPSASAVQHMFHFTGTATYFILASSPTPLNSYLSLIHSSVQILFMILLLLSSPASLHCSTPSITWRFISARLKSDVGVALSAQPKWTIIIVTLYFTLVYSYS